MRQPSLLRALVLRLIIGVIVALLLSFALLYFKFTSGIFEIDDQSVLVQVKNLRKAVVLDSGPPRLAIPENMRELYSTPGTLNGYQLLSADGRVLASEGFLDARLPPPMPVPGKVVILQRESDSRTGRQIVAATVMIEHAGEMYSLRVLRNLDDLESFVGQLILRALPEFFPSLVFLLIAVIGVVVLTVHASLRPLRAISKQAAALSADSLSDRLHAENLPMELLPLVQAVNTALGRLEADYQSQRDFTANAAHELRTPLAILRARLESRFTSEELGDVGVEIEALGKMVEQLLCLAQLDSQINFDSAPFDAYSCALEVARDLAPQAISTDHRVSAAPADAVMTQGNATLIRLVFRNLIENAIQHTPPGTSIQVTALDPHTVMIEDDGPGIPPDQAEVIFERFKRGSAAKGSGAGLGLSIARRIMERSHGKLLLNSNATTRGAQFLVIFG